MGPRRRASSSEWRQYYERADRVRAIVGDPFRAHITRAIARKRLLIISCTVCGVVMATALTLWAIG